MDDTRAQIETKVRDFLVDEFEWKRPVEELTDFDLIGSGILDSIAIFKIVEFVESAFPVMITDEDIQPARFDTVAHIADLVVSKLSADDRPAETGS